MSLANIKTKTQEGLNDIYTALEEKSATIPEQKNLINVAPAIRSISGGNIKVHTVTFDSNGGSEVAEQIIVSGQTAKEPESTRDGYKIKYWALNGAEYDFTTPITENLTLVAVWREVLVPEGYTELEYIESTGTQYIDTMVLPNSDLKIEIDFQIIENDNTNNWQPFFGFRLWNSTNKTDFAGYYSPNDKTNVSFPCGSNDGNGYLNSPVTNRTQLTYDITGLYHGEQKVVSYTTQTFKETATSRSCVIFGLKTDNAKNPAPAVGNLQLMKLYSFKIYDNETMIRNFVPALNQNNICGLWDTVNKVFYQNVGSGSFNAGSVVE